MKRKLGKVHAIFNSILVKYDFFFAPGNLVNNVWNSNADQLSICSRQFLVKDMLFIRHLSIMQDCCS